MPLNKPGGQVSTRHVQFIFILVVFHLSSFSCGRGYGLNMDSYELHTFDVVGRIVAEPLGLSSRSIGSSTSLSQITMLIYVRMYEHILEY